MQLLQIQDLINEVENCIDIHFNYDPNKPINLRWNGRLCGPMEVNCNGKSYSQVQSWIDRFIQEITNSEK